MQEFSQIDTFNKIARWWGFYIQKSKTGQNYFQCAFHNYEIITDNCPENLY